MAPLRPMSVVRFGAYEVDLQSGELRKSGVRIRVQQQPMKVLEILLEHCGEVVGREELRRKIWPSSTFGDFDQAVNVAVAKLRTALGDSAESPRFIETLPRRGYRFIAPVRDEPAVLVTPGFEVSQPTTIQSRASRTRPKVLLPVTAAIAVLIATLGFLLWRERSGEKPERNRIMLAVLPFENLSNDPEQEYFSDGLTEEVIAELGRLNPQQLGLIARLSALKYKHTEKSAAQIAQELHVDYLVEGSVQRFGDRVHVAIELIRGRDQTRMWSDSYDRESRDIVALQGDLSSDVARQIRIKLGASVKRAAASIDPGAHEAYLKGRFFFGKRNSNDLALKYFLEATERDPNYALPYTGLADLYQLQDNPQLARAAVDKALQLDDELAEAHNSLAGLLYRVDRDWRGAEREFRRALELDPNYAAAHHWYSMYLSVVGRKQQALIEAQKAYALDPLSPIAGANLAKILEENDQLDAAVHQAKQTLEIEPESAVTHAVLGYVFDRKKMYSEAINEYRKSLDLGGPPGEIRGLLGYTYAVSGNRAAAEKIVDELKALWPAHSHAALDLAVVFCGMGDRESAFYWLGKADRAKVSDLIGIGQDPRLVSLRGDPRFQGLMLRVSPQ